MRVAVYQLNKELAKSEAILIDEGKDLSTANAKLYDAMDNEETVGVEAFADDGPTPEEQAITQEIYDRFLTISGGKRMTEENYNYRTSQTLLRNQFPGHG